MSSPKRLFSTWFGIVLTGLAVGVLAPVLVKFGNPGNMGICVACFNRDIAGALGLHRAGLVQYIRPEIVGFVLGALVAALAFREFRPRTGASPLVRFVLGAFAMIGALMFLGCPWRAYLRLSAGDWNAILGIGGLACGIVLGIVFLKMGFSLGRSRAASWPVGWVIPAVALCLLLLLVASPLLGRDPDGRPVGPVFSSTEGPGSMHAPILVSLAVGLLVGFLAQRSRFCTVGAIRDVLMLRDPHLLIGVLTLIGAAVATNLLLGQFRSGFAEQPVAHTDLLMNFGGMLLSGLAFTLAGGCPGRQVFLAGEGDADAGVFVIGMIVGAGFAHNFSLASSPKGEGAYGVTALAAGLVVCVLLGLTMRDVKQS